MLIKISILTIDQMSKIDFNDDFMNIEFVCPDCGNLKIDVKFDDSVGIPNTGSGGPHYTFWQCGCGWKGRIPMELSIYKNKNRTELIDKILK